MAILLIKIEDPASLPLNEFYDYNGHAYALTRSRFESDPICIDLEDFYEAAMGVSSLSGIPVIFLLEAEGKLSICGWYRSASISAQSTCPAFFLEGNVIAASSDVCLLPQAAENSARPSLVREAEQELNKTGWLLGHQYYEVVEKEDFRHAALKKLVDHYQGKNAFLRYSYQKPMMAASLRHNYDQCIDKCAELASAVMEDRCSDIRDIILLEAYARQASSMNSRKADGFYYLAMADYQLGFLRPAMKAIEKALRIEPDGADLFAQKAYILLSMGYSKEAADAFHNAFVLSGEEDYSLWEGKAHLLAGRTETAYAIFRQIKDSALLKAAGIDLQNPEHRWSFQNFRGFRFRNPFRK